MMRSPRSMLFGGPLCSDCHHQHTKDASLAAHLCCTVVGRPGLLLHRLQLDDADDSAAWQDPMDSNEVLME